MKKLTLTLLVATMLCGCAHLPLEDQARIANHVGYDVALKTLSGHPERRDEVATAALTLRRLAAQPQLDAIAVVELMQPFAQSDDARIAMDGGLFVIALAGNPTIKTDKAEKIKTLANGLAGGFERRLAEP